MERARTWPAQTFADAKASRQFRDYSERGPVSVSQVQPAFVGPLGLARRAHLPDPPDPPDLPDLPDLPDPPDVPDLPDPPDLPDLI